MNKRNTFTALFVAAAGYLAAQNVKPLTLQEALNLAVANSKELQLSKTSIEQAQAKLAQAKSAAWPEVKVSGTYMAINTPSLSFPAPPDGDGGSSGGSGGSNPLAALSNMHQIMLGQVTVSEPLFAGFRIRNTKVMQQYLAEAARYDETTTQNKVIANTARALYQYYELLETQKLIDQHLKQAQQRVAEFKNLEAQGVLAKNDRLKDELQVNNIELTRTEVGNNVQMAEYNLSILLGLPEGTSLALDTTDMFKNTIVDTWENLVQKSVDNRAELKAAQLQVEAGKAGVRVAKASRYPSVALSGGYVDAYIPNVVTVTNALNGGLGIQYNLSGAIHSKYQIQEAKATQHRAEISQQMMNDKIRVEVKQKFLNLQKAIEKIGVSQRAIDQARENFTISKNKYDAGLMIFSDYLDADVTLLQTQINYATARAESMIAYYELQEATGTIQ